jgi:phage N-6-adenine-methyltransferase
MDATTPISALRKPTLARLISESLADQRIIKSAEEQARRGSERALQAWFRQSLRLHIAHTEHGLRNERFIDFARKLGVDKSSAYLLRHLHRHEAQITERCLDEAESAAQRAQPFYYPGWLTALGWFHKFGRNAKFGGHTLNGRWNNDDKATPPHIAKRYAAHCTLDVAASDENHVCPKWFTKKQNGLKQEWLGTVWMNPPYSNLPPWCIKAVEHAESGGTVIALLPAWTDAKWFHDYVSLGKVTYLRNRLKFGGAENHAPFASIIVVWTREIVQAARLRQGMGDFSVFGGLERQSPYQFRHPQATRYILTPPVLYQSLDAEHHFDFDHFPTRARRATTACKCRGAK